MSNEKRVPPDIFIDVGGDESAVAEAYAFASGKDLKKIEEIRQHERREGARNAVSRILTIGLWLVFVVAVFGGLVWSWHLLAPSCWHWLTPEQLADIKETFFSATLGFVFGVVAKYKFL